MAAGVGAGIGAVIALAVFLALTGMNSGEGDGVTAGLEELGTRIDAIEGQESVDLGPLEERLAALEEQAGQGGQAVTAEDIAGLREELEAARESAGAIDPARVEPLYELPDRVAALDERVGAVETALENVGENRAALGVAVITLQGALSRGEPFADELAAIERFDSVPNARTEPLRAHAEDGVPTVPELARRFEAVSGDLLASASGSGESVVDRMLSGARSMVRVRPAGPVEGDGAGAVVSRIDAALAEGDMERALAEWERLPEPARQASAEWGEDARARLEAQRLTEELTATLMNAPSGEGAQGGGPGETGGETSDGAGEETTDTGGDPS